jgi:4-hydroxy-2-oxoglutarate aldolase
VADASPVPVILYNFTALTGVTLQPAAVATLSAHPNIVGMKESGGDAGQIADLVAGTPKDFSILAGSAGTFYASMCVGAVGGILALACVVPEPCVRLFELIRAGHHPEALALQRQLVPLAKLLGQSYGVPGLKAAMSIIGYDVGVPRPPLAPVPEAAVKALRDAIAQLEGIPA